MKTFLRTATIAASLLTAATVLTGCGPEQEEQFNSVLSSSDYRTSQVAPHIRTASSSGVYYLSTLPAVDRRHPQQHRALQPDRHRPSRQTQLGPAAVN